MHFNNLRSIEFNRRHLCKKMLKRRKFYQSIFIFSDIFCRQKKAREQTITLFQKYASQAHLDIQIHAKEFTAF